MPLYEFSCSACSQVSEILCQMGETGQELACPKCGSSGLTKRMSVTAVPQGTSRQPGRTCCGREERCDPPPCGGDFCGRNI
ncbi:MAG TPA: zinc ribbon domain-containing protein [Deltaproteobacteria bacterium]|nr:zinc ribbon domain-containing protein [Deltaproteobacteria bacterium]